MHTEDRNVCVVHFDPEPQHESNRSWGPEGLFGASFTAVNRALDLVQFVCAQVAGLGDQPLDSHHPLADLVDVVHDQRSVNLIRPLPVSAFHLFSQRAHSLFDREGQFACPPYLLKDLKSPFNIIADLLLYRLSTSSQCPAEDPDDVIHIRLTL
uniref:Uncharacterized protein n=1 Tax=Anguilla anguilla TaxID=7936 RepID=A0A0E9X517_ANGAN